MRFRTVEQIGDAVEILIHRIDELEEQIAELREKNEKPKVTARSR